MFELLEAVTIVSAGLAILCVGGLVADFVFPHIPFVEKFLSTLPDLENED